MPEDYKEAVLSEYENKKKNVPNLLNPTPGNLRNECLIVYRERYSPIDNEILRLFFNETDKESGYLKSIENSKAEKFKQLSKILKGEIPTPGDRYIELIAWLINFNPRPSPLYYKSLSKNPPQPPIPWKNIIITSFFLILTVVFGIILYTSSSNDATQKESTAKYVPSAGNKSTKTLISNPEKSANTKRTLIKDMQCMYWSNDHYEPISCNQDISGATKIALDKQKVMYFKKINEPDTLSHNSLGKVWQVRINGELEYYTSEGFHPIYTDRKLRLLSEYMLNKYILSKR